VVSWGWFAVAPNNSLITARNERASRSSPAAVARAVNCC